MNLKNTKSNIASHPLLAWDIMAMQNWKRLNRIQFATAYHFHAAFNWDIDLDKLFSVKFDAIVITDTEQVIQWVSKGFEKMTGYKSSDAIERKPSFLQGPETSIEVKNNLRQQIGMYKPVSGSLINYKKGGEPYSCIVNITPVFDKDQVIQHFIALETEITAL